jgi:ABC-type multidrug transport system permease subunit
MEKEKKFAKDIFDFDLEKKIFKYLYYGKKRKLDKENQINSYMDWKHRIEKMYSSFSIEQLQDFSRWLNQKIRDSKPSHEYSQICITVLITWFLTKVLDEYCNRITNLKISFLAIVIFSIIVFFIVLYGCSKLYDMLFTENMKIALYTDYKEVIDDLISQKEKRGIVFELR